MCGVTQARTLPGAGAPAQAAAALAAPANSLVSNASMGAGGRRQLLQNGAITVSRGDGRLWLLYFNAALDFYSSAAACQALGGQLLTVASAADTAALMAAAVPFPNVWYMWIGLRSRNNSPTTNKAEWIWLLTGQSPAYDNWGGPNPDNSSGNEGVCGHADLKAGGWNDMACGAQMSYGCEVPVCDTQPLTATGAVPFQGISLPAGPGTTLTAACGTGYTGAGFTTTCQQSGQWVYNGACNPVCQNAPQTQVGGVPFPTISLPADISTTVVSATCAKGYSGFNTATCQGPNQWSYSGICQRDALGNSDVCLDTIPKCEAGACASRSVRGVAKSVCLRCLGNYVPVLDDGGNIVQCVCPASFYEDGANTTSCTRCPANSFCPGGGMVENPLTRGPRTECGNLLITRSTGAKSRFDCVAPAGHALASPFAAAPCGPGEYAPALNRLAKCLKCAAGLAEDASLNLTAPLRSNKKAVCKVPPGRYIDMGLIRTCPQGFFREAYLDYDSANATKCLPCNPGITTSGAGAGLASLCSVVLPGYGIDVLYNATSASGVATIPALPSPATGLPTASVCDFGFYSNGGFCAQCPAGSATQNKGSIAMEACMVPPGYVIKNATMSQCVAGEYRPGWLMFNDARATACMLCGENILSEPRNIDENPMVANGSLTRATSDCCYIEAGMGMIATAKNAYKAQSCPANSYGATGKVYGLTSAACKPCARNLVTDGATRVNSSETCVNDDGWGYASDGASRCAPGFYSWKGSRRPCQQCPAGRTTLDQAAFQRTIEDCLVAVGYGIVKSANSSDAWDVDVRGLTPAQLAVLPVMECPVGYYGPGDSVGGKCIKCDGTSTVAPGAGSAAQCVVCWPGYGKPDNSTTSKCQLCELGSYQPGTLPQCQTCPSSAFYAPVDGAGATHTSAGTSFYKGAVRVEDCVPAQSQLAPEAGQAFFATDSPLQPLLAASQQPDLASCLATCAGNACCLAQYDVPSRTCKTATLTPDVADAPAGLQLLYKLPPAGPAAAALSLRKKGGGGGGGGGQVSARSLSSGWYATCAVPALQAAAWQALGAGLGRDARTFSTNSTEWDVATSRAACKAKCDDSNVCFGFLYDAASGSCLFRGGVDALASRAFFVLPTSVDLAAIKWAAGASSP